MENSFVKFKETILERARKADACREQYGRAYKAETYGELMEVIKDNFVWAVNHGVLDGPLIDTYSAEFNSNGIRHNENVTGGYLLASGNATVEAYGNATVEAYGNATVEAYGNATVRASGNATVEAYGNATVEAYGNATVRAYDNATVEAYGNAYVISYDIFECKLSDNAIWRITRTNTIRYTAEDMIFEKQPQ